MASLVTDLQRIGLKFFVEDSRVLRLEELIPLFHQWIQRHAVEGLLIDVANYGHLYEGPGIVLIAHEGNYSIDFEGGRMGLLYQRKQPVEGTLSERLTSLCRTVLEAGRLLEQEPRLGGRLTFCGDELQIVANDRLLAPNSEETLATFQQPLSEFVGTLYDNATCEVSHATDPRERFTLTITAPQPVRIQRLLDRLDEGVAVSPRTLQREARRVSP